MRGELQPRLVLPKDAPARARAPSRERGAAAASPQLDAAATALFERLRAHRADIARQRRVPPYVVALDRTLVLLATQRPRTLADFAGIHGMGPVRIEQFGAGFLAILEDG